MTKHQPATPRYFIDQYGHIYRWEPTATGQTSVPVANWHNSGSAKESALLVDRANAYPKLVEALRRCVEPAVDKTTREAEARAILRELGEAE